MTEENGVAVVRKELALMPLVSRTWFDWDWSMETESFQRTLVIEVTCDTDPNSTACDPAGIEELGETVRRVLRDQTTMIVTGLRIVPKAPPQFTPPQVPGF
jgi:hypothetical protein